VTDSGKFYNIIQGRIHNGGREGASVGLLESPFWAEICNLCEDFGRKVGNYNLTAIGTDPICRNFGCSNPLFGQEYVTCVRILARKLEFIM
jgi:hypothetical protein